MDKNFNNKLNEIDSLLNEKEQSLKKKIFSLSKMEALVFSDPKLTSVYDEMSVNGEEKYGYHYNETIMNMIFNDYVLNSSKYLQKYKMAIPKKKKRRDKSGINKLRHDSEKIATPQQKAVDETTTAGSAGGSAGYVGYAGPAAWSKTAEPMRKPLYVGGTVVDENVNYLIDASVFKLLAENFDQDGVEEPQFSQKTNVKPYDNPEINNTIIDKTSAFSSDTVKQWDKPDTELEYHTLKSGIFDNPHINGSVDESLDNFYQNMNPKDAIAKAKIDYSSAMKQNNQGLADKISGNLKTFLSSKGYNWNQDPSALEIIDEKAVSKAQQRFMGMVHAVQKGDLPANKVGKSVAKAAKSMNPDDVDDFAGTKHDKLPEKIDEDYSITKLNPLKQIGWMSIPSYKYGGVAVFEINNEDSFGKNLKADYIIGSPYEIEYMLKPYGENNYVVNDNPRFWSRYVFVDEDTHRVYALNEDDKYKYFAKYKDISIDPNKNWTYNIDMEKFVRSIDDLKKKGATFKFMDSDLEYNSIQEDENQEYDLSEYEPTIRKIVNNINSIEQLSDMMKYFVKQYKIADKDKAIAVIMLAKKLFDEKNVVNEVSMIDHNDTSMKTSEPIDTQGSGVDRGMMNNSGNISEKIKEKDMKENEKENLDELLNELDNLSEQHNKLVVMAEDRKPSALVLKDRLGNENAKNFKDDFNNSGTKETIDVEKELQYADQQTPVGDNPYKNGEDIEKKVSEKALENVGDSTADGKHVPKRNLTDDEAKEVDDYRLGLGDVKFDNEVGEKFENRMKTDMGDDFYAKRQRRLEVQANQPMYNKDVQPTETEKEKPIDITNKFKQNLGESMITGKYVNSIGKTRLIDFMAADVIISESVQDDFTKISLDGLGNTYENKLNTNTNKLEINENVVEVIDSYNFYLKENKVYAVKKLSVLNENKEVANTVINENLDKMKHLLGYNPNNFVKTKGNTKI